MDPYMMQSDAPMISGQWYNPKTGDSFVVRDSYLEDNEYIIQAMDGRRFNYDMIADYIQSDGPVPKMPEQAPTVQINKNALLEGLDADEPLGDSILNNPISSNSQAPTNSTGTVHRQEESFERQLVNRVLKKAQQPQIKCSIAWSKFPTRQMDMLVNLMDVSVEEICDYYIEQMDVESIRERIKDELKNYLDTQMGIEVVEEPAPKKKKK